MILGGNFRQILPIVQKGAKTQMILHILLSLLCEVTQKYHIYEKKKWSLQDHNFVENLMRNGDEIEPTNLDDMVKIP